MWDARITGQRALWINCRILQNPICVAYKGLAPFDYSVKCIKDHVFCIQHMFGFVIAGWQDIVLNQLQIQLVCVTGNNVVTKPRFNLKDLTYVFESICVWLLQMLDKQVILVLQRCDLFILPHQGYSLIKGKTYICCSVKGIIIYAWNLWAKIFTVFFLPNVSISMHIVTLKVFKDILFDCQ